MTDLEKLKELLDSFGVKYEKTKNDLRSINEIRMDPLAGGETKIEGDSWTCCEFCFDMCGKFKSIYVSG